MGNKRRTFAWLREYFTSQNLVGKLPTVEAVGLMTRSDAELLARHCLREGKIISGFHFREKLAERGFDMNDARFVLKYGHIFTEPEKDIKTGEWKYRLEAKLLDGEFLAVVVCFKMIGSCFLITIF